MLSFIAGVSWVLGTAALAYFTSRFFVHQAKQAIQDEIEKLKAESKRQELEPRITSIESKLNLLTAFRKDGPR